MKNKKPQSVRSGSGRRRVISDVSPSTSVPPLVEGQVRCFLRVTVSRVLWTINRPPPVTLVRLRWWGESSGGTVFCPRDGSLTRQKDVKSTSRFPVRCGPKQFTSYLTDMGSLVLDVLTKPDHLPIARVQIAGIARLSLSHSINGFFTLVSPTSEKLGELQVALALEPLTETYDSSGSVPTTDMSTDAAVPAPGPLSDQDLPAPPLVQLGPNKRGRESVGGSSNSTPRGKDHLYFQERGDVPMRSRSALKLDEVAAHQKPGSYGSRTGTEPALNTDNNSGVRMPSGDSRASVDLLSVLLERGSKLRNAMVVSALKSDTDCDVLKDVPLPLPRDNTGVSPLSLPVPSSGQLLQNILHSDLHNSSQDPDHLRPEGTTDAHDVAVDLLLGSVNGSLLPVWDGDVSPAGSLSGCSSVLMDSELGDPQYDQSLLENLFYKTSRADSCLSEEEETRKKPSPEKNNRLDSGVGQHAGAEGVFSGLTVDRIACLGSVHVARVIILQLTVPTDCISNIPRKPLGKGKPPRPLTSKKCSYFVEYLFPLPLTDDDTRLAVPAEVTRVVSSKVVDGVVNFQQRSVFPVHFSGSTIKQWWDTSLTFKVFSRKSYQKKPVPIGVAKFPLRSLLQSNRLSITTSIPVQKQDGDSDKPDIGPLKVSLELAADKKDFSSKSRKTVLSPSASPRKAPPPEADLSPGPQGEGHSGDFTPVLEIDSRRGPSPLTVPPPQNILMPRSRSRSTSPRSRVQNSPRKSPKTPQSAAEDERELLLHTLLAVPDGKDFSCAPLQPNVYLNCKLFGSEETTRSVVSWGQTHPTFNLVQVAPVALNSRLLERMKNNVMIVEVWLRASSSHNDKLLGLVKLPLHQFYMSFRDPKISQLLLKSQYPVLAVDSYMPVVDIFTGGTRGSLRVCLAMGLSQQITALQRMRDEELASVSQLPRPAHLLDHRPAPEMKVSAAPVALSEHVFTVRVEKVRGLTPLQATVWGEADCYIHYSFPAQEDDAGQGADPNVVESSVNLKSYRTATSLCVPDPVFGHSETHVLVAPPDVPVQRLLLSSLASQGLSGGGGIPFEVWCRYYYPNVREQLVARGVLPMARLCAMVTMQRQGQTEAQLFSLPLIPRSDRPSDVQPQPSGLLEVSVQYRTRPVRGSGGSSGALASRVVNLVVQVHRAAGLKAAARAAALQYYSEVGVNCFVTVQLSLLSERESRSTRVVARSFSPEFEYHAEFCCQMLVQRDAGESVSLAELLEEAVAVFTVYNRDTRKGVDALIPKDVVLGSVRIRLADLLHKRTGISGWYGLSVPPSVSSHRNLTTVGGLELSVHFSHHADRERVLSSARLLGWRDTGGDDEEEEEGDEEEGRLGSGRWQSMGLSVSIPRAWLPVHCLLLPGHAELQRSTYCYYRYKLYDQDTFCSELRHPIVEAIEGEESGGADVDSGIASVSFPGNQTVDLRGSQPLLWYLREEKLEVQLWVSFGKGKRIRPHDSDRLVGSAFLSLSTLTRPSKQKLTISGVYPLFKRSAADLGGAALRVHITATMGPALPPAPALLQEMEEVEEQLSSPGEEEEVPVSRLSRSADGVSRWSRIPSRQPTKATIISEPPPPSCGAELSEEETFTARISVERAMHLSLKGCPLAERGGGLPSCCVSYATADASGTLSTDVVRDSDCPVWDHHQECRLSKELLVDPQQALVFKVWHKGELERVIGFASVDLSPLLSGFQSVSGWYNITDFSGQCQGQIKVSVSPLSPGVQELRPQRLALCENITTDSSSLFSALPLCYQTTAMYSSFPSHITRFPEQRISSPPEQIDVLLSDRSSVADRHDEHMDNVRRFHHALQEGASAPLPSGAGDAHPSSSALFSALRKNLSELDDIQKYFSRKLATPVFSGMGEEGRDARQEQHRDSETDTTQLLLRSNQLVGEVNSIIKGLGTRQTEPASSNPQQIPSTPPEREADVFLGVDGLRCAESESCDTEGCSLKESERRLEDISPYTSPAAGELSNSPVPADEDVPQDNLSSEEENGRNKVNDAEEEDDEEEEEDEEFEETLVEPRTLNEVTSITDRTSPWTSVLSDPDLCSLESLEVEEHPLWGSQNITQAKKRDSAGSLPAVPSQHLASQSNDDSDQSDGFESVEELEAVRDVQSVCEEQGEEHGEELRDEQESSDESWAAVQHWNSTQGTKLVEDHGHSDTSDDNGDDDDEVEDEDESPLPLSSGSSTKENNGESDENKTKLCDDVEIPNFFLPSHHLEASMRALRLAPVFPSVSSDPDVKSADQHRNTTRPRLILPPSSANREEETKRIAKIFASRFTEGGL